MTIARSSSDSQQVAILAPIGRDAVLTQRLLESALVDGIVVSSTNQLAEVIREGIGCVLVTEEALIHGGIPTLSAELSRQAAWSDLPILLLATQGASSQIVRQAQQSLVNTTLLERPLRPATLVSAVRAALKARSRQYQLRDHLLELANSEHALREADQRKDEFLATLAHELRNPLAPIQSAMHYLRLTSCEDPAIEQICDMLDRQVGQLTRLVEDLLEVSRITRGKIELRIEPIEVAGVIRSAVEASRPVIDASGHQLAISLPLEPLFVNGDQVRLSQVLTNLLTNSAKYMQEGGQIWLSARRDAENVVISVRDAGIGIPSDMLPQIFEMFTQVDRSKRRSQGGLGIGLTLVRTLVEMHSGSVEAHSPGIDMGSEFIVRLPLSGPIRSPSVERHAPEVLNVPRHRILVVDDNRDAAKMLAKLLERLGAEVRIENDGPSAIEALAPYAPNVVLLDIGMPGMDGYEVARRMRQQPAGHDVMLIALTGWGQAGDRHQAQNAGFDHHLLKPVNIEALRSLLMSLSCGTKD